MHRRTTVAALMLGSMLIEGCAQRPVDVGICKFRRYSLTVEDPDSSFDPGSGDHARKVANLAAGQTDSAGRARMMSQFMAVAPSAAPPGPSAREPEATFAKQTLAGAVSDALAAHEKVRSPRNADSMLFLSGGSEHGAYGAGFLYQWQQDRRDQKLPDFAVVTGVSTGAILATYAFVSRTDLAVAGYTIHDEKELLDAHGHPPRDGGLGAGQFLGLVFKGSVADLRPLRAHLSAYLPDDVLTAVANEGEQNQRLLVVGAVNVDTGDAEGFDLTEMAKRWRDAPQALPHDRKASEASGNTKAHFKDCYIAAIVASASAPVAAAPVFIDNREYMDGGARFGVFSDELGSVITQKSAHFVNQWADITHNRSFNPQALSALALASTPPPVPVQYVIINGTLRIPPVCATGIDCDKNKATSEWETTGGDYGKAPHLKWSIVGLGQRTGEDILPNQVYRFSASQIEAQSKTEKNLFKFTKIGADAGSFPVNIDHPSSPDGKRTCDDYEVQDKGGVVPVQFHPLYMRCLIEYGKSRADDEVLHGDWDPTR